ncbi:unnamed protein product, partial [Prorocentrum cordatum]
SAARARSREGSSISLARPRPRPAATATGGGGGRGGSEGDGVEEEGERSWHSQSTPASEYQGSTCSRFAVSPGRLCNKAKSRRKRPTRSSGHRLVWFDPWFSAARRRVVPHHGRQRADAGGAEPEDIAFARGAVEEEEEEEEEEGEEEGEEWGGAHRPHQGLFKKKPSGACAMRSARWPRAAGRRGRGATGRGEERRPSALSPWRLRVHNEKRGGTAASCPAALPELPRPPPPAEGGWRRVPHGTGRPEGGAAYREPLNFGACRTPSTAASTKRATPPSPSTRAATGPAGPSIEEKDTNAAASRATAPAPGTAAAKVSDDVPSTADRTLVRSSVLRTPCFSVRVRGRVMPAADATEAARDSRRFSSRKDSRRLCCSTVSSETGVFCLTVSKSPSAH